MASLPLPDRATMPGVRDAFDLTGRVTVITGGAGLLGRQHAEAVIEAGGIPVLLDVNGDAAEAVASELGHSSLGIACDVSDSGAVERALAEVLERLNRVDALINNAAANPKVEADTEKFMRLESFPLEIWDSAIAVGLTGAFLCSRFFGSEMARSGSGAILNIASDLALIGPDQRLYRNEGTAEEEQPVKPVSYSVVKAGILGLTRYIATYWAKDGVRANSLSPGGVLDGQDGEFLERISSRIPLGRMAQPDEYRAAVVFLISDASSYMTGANLVIDGGRTAW